jgi:phosphoribosyl-AMP cyclohydrolase / phosphoribosyl-ATP pyrophosphohydrolase
MNLNEIKFDESGLVPAIVQDSATRQLLTLAYMNAESLQRTIETGETWFWSRSRNRLWHKGETSGHTQRVVSMTLDCDGDAVALLVEPRGPACHTGAPSCFERTIHGTPIKKDLAEVLTELFAVINSRRQELPEGSYTTYLFKQGLDKILKKIGEEAGETIIAAKNDDTEALVAEISDLLYHLLVLMAARGVTLRQVRDELQDRRKEAK